MRVEIRWNESSDTLTVHSDISREKFHIFSRHCADVTARFYEVKDIVLGSCQKHQATKSFILDCEIVAYDKVHNKYYRFKNLAHGRKKLCMVAAMSRM